MSSTIQGYVRHNLDGNPMANARVTLEALGTGVPRSIATDREGWFAFRNLAAGRYRVAAAGSRAEDVMLDEYSNVTIELGAVAGQPFGVGAIFGKVIEKTAGFPVENASVMLVSGPKAAPDIAAITNALGEFSFERLAPGAWTLRAVAPEGAVTQLLVEVVADDTALVTIAISDDSDGCRCRE